MFQNSIFTTTPVSSGNATSGVIAGSVPNGGIAQGQDQTASSRPFSQTPVAQAPFIPLPTTGKEYLAWTSVMVLIAGLIALQLWISLVIAQTEQEINTLNQEYTTIEQANAEMLWKISQYTSLSYVQREARRAGFVTALQPSYRFAPPQPATTLTGETVMPVAPQDERVSFLAEPDERIVPIAATPEVAPVEISTGVGTGQPMGDQLSQGVQEAWARTQSTGQQIGNWFGNWFATQWDRMRR